MSTHDPECIFEKEMDESVMGGLEKYGVSLAEYMLCAASQ